MIAHRHSQRLGAEAQRRRAEAGLNFICVHLNRSIRPHGLSMMSITGPGHGGPGLIANACLEATYSELYPNISRGEAGMKRLFKQVSFPGGELGYALSHAYGAAFDNPDQIVACVVGDARPRPGR